MNWKINSKFSMGNKGKFILLVEPEYPINNPKTHEIFYKHQLVEICE